MCNRIGVALTLRVLFICALAGSSAANAFTFEQIASTNTASLSDPRLNFSALGTPSISGDTVVFRAVTPDFRNPFSGIYSYSGGALHVVADNRSRPADPTGAFFDFGNPSISGNNVAFTGLYAPDDHSRSTSGLFVKNGAGITTIANLNTASLSDPGANFSALGTPSISGDTVVFRAVTPDFRNPYSGIYSYSGGALHVVADNRSRPADPTGAFFDFGNPSISGNNVAFTALYAPDDHSRSTSGLFVKNGAGITTIANLNTASLSDPRLNFSALGTPSISGDTVVFRAVTPDFRNPYSGIYSYSGGVLHVVADNRSRPADPTGAFFDFGDPSISGNNIAFTALYAPDDHSRSTSGLFVSLDGVIEEIIQAGDILDGLTVQGFGFGDGGIDGDSLSFIAEFTDGSTALYRVDIGSVPEPATYVLLITSLGLLGVGARRRTQKQRTWLAKQDQSIVCYSFSRDE